MGYDVADTGLVARVGLPPVGVPIAPGAYTDAQGRIWLCYVGPTGQPEWRAGSGLLLTPTSALWPAVLRNSGALPFRRMVPVKRRT